MPRVLVTGAAGFIGRCLSRQLQAEHSVTALGRNVVEGPWSDFVKHDISTGERLPPQATDGVDTIYHLASKAHALSEKPGSSEGYHDVIVTGTEAVVRSAEQAGVQRLVYLSSVKAMGEGSGAIWQEQPIDAYDTSKPTSPYGLAKLEAEDIVLKSQIPHVTVLRPVMVYGPGHKGNLVRMAEAIQKKRFPPLAENGNKRSIVHVDNLVAACLLVAKEPLADRKKYILAEPWVYSTRQLYDQIRLELGLSPIQWSIPSPVLQAGALVGDMLGRITGRRMPLDSDSLQKLLSSAWYDGNGICDQLGYAYKQYPLLGDSDRGRL